MDENSKEKRTALRAHFALHPHPELVIDEAFISDSFFDPNDLVQVKYEMLRRHREEQQSVTEVARTFGTSRQAFYAAQALFESEGIPGLLPKRRGPHGAHKCTDEVLDFVEQWKATRPEETSLRAAEAVERQFGTRIHPRTIDRALARRKKKRWHEPETPA
jgi:transposase